MCINGAHKWPRVPAMSVVLESDGSNVLSEYFFANKGTVNLIKSDTPCKMTILESNGVLEKFIGSFMRKIYC